MERCSPPPNEEQTTEFQRLQEAGTLEISYSGRPLDLYTFGVVQLNMHDIVEKVTLSLLLQEGVIEPTWKHPRYLPQRPPLPYQRIIEAEISQVEIGSLNEAIVFAIASILADPNVLAVLHNLAANVVWAIGASGVRGIQKRISAPPNNYLWRRKDNDPIEIGANLREVLLALAEHNDGHNAELRIRSRTPNREETEVVLLISRHE